MFANDLFEYRDAFLSEHGPDEPGVRFVLLAISLHMSQRCENACPSQEYLQARTKLGLRSIRRHIESAEQLGWLERQQVRRRKGRNWYFTKFVATIPDEVYARIKQSNPQAATVAGTPGVPANNDTTTGHRERDERSRWPTNSSSELITKQEAARPANADAAAGPTPNPKPDADQLAAIRDMLFVKKYPADEIPRLLQRRGVTRDMVNGVQDGRF